MLYHKWFSIVCILGTCLCARMSAQETLKQSPSKTLIIVGAGTGGTAAAIQAARMGVEVHLLSENPWLGGMLTAAGVSAIDGNHQLPSGLWGEFRDKLYQHYGGPKAVATGWVSNTHFEPKVGDSILKTMAQHPQLNIHYNTEFKGITRRENVWEINFVSEGKITSLRGTVVIDATENGDLLPLVGAAFKVGMDATSDTGEKEATPRANSIVQDLTYTLILKDLGRDALPNELLSKPPSYNSGRFKCACRLPGSDPQKGW